MASRAIKNRPDIKKKSFWPGILMVFTVFFAFVGVGIVGVYALGSSWLEDIPDYSNTDAYNTARKTEVYANDGTTLLAEFYIENREPVAFDQINQYVKDGTIATEDERFYEHDGIDLWGIGRAIVVNMTGTSLEGASTITQQFVRQTILSEEATDISFRRKTREMYIALKLEEMYTKDEILLSYLNTINYGTGAYGIEAASHTYFSKAATDLTLSEAAALIGIPQSPTYNNPIDNYDTCVDRRNVVLERMLRNGYITQEEHDASVAEELILNPENQVANGIYLYPYFTSYVRDALLDQFTEAEVFKGGMKVYTTIDPGIQAMAEEAARNKEAVMAQDIEVALTAVDPNTGFIKAMVGGKDFYADQYNLATQAKRSCGSAFKTFTLLAALEAGISPYTYINCSSKVTIGDWSPENYGGANYGTRTISSAFAVSSNTAFARLITAIGPEPVVEMAHRLGIKSNIPALPSITLGSVEVSTDEMAGAVATIANGGVHHEVTGIERILDVKGEVIYQADVAGDQVISPEIAYAARNVMKGVVNSYEGTGYAASLSNGQPVIGKTGTSENYRDSYFIGSTPQISVAIWMGARQEREMPPNYIAANVFGDFVGKVLSGQPIVDFPFANDPQYAAYSDSLLNIGYGSNPSTNKTDDDAKEETQNPVPTPEPTPTPEPDPEPEPEPPPTPPGPGDGGEEGGG